MAKKEEKTNVMKLSRRDFRSQLRSMGVQVKAIITIEENHDDYILGAEADEGNEWELPVIIETHEFDALELLTYDELVEDVLGSANSAIVDAEETSLCAENWAKKFLKGKYSAAACYCVKFYFLQQKGSSGPMLKSLGLSDKTAALKADAYEAAKRTAVKKMVKAVQKPLAGLLKSQGRNDIAAMLSTEQGQAILAGLLGVLQLMLPQLQSEGAVVIGEELRTQALGNITESLGEVLDPVIDSFTEAAASLPKVI